LEFLEALSGVIVYVVQQHHARMIFNHYKHVGLLLDNVVNMVRYDKVKNEFCDKQKSLFKFMEKTQERVVTTI
jgi:hypothetical protein